MSSSNSQQFLEALGVVRNARHTPEVQAVLKMLKLLEQGAMEELVASGKEQHEVHAGAVKLFRKLHADIAEPTFNERQAQFKVKTNG